MILSAVVLTKNEEKRIAQCIKNLSFCDEVIIIDDYSNDRTRELAKKNKAIVYKRRLNGNFAEQRNYGLKKAKGKWVLFIDADEIVTPQLRNEIVSVVNDSLNQYIGFYIKREDIFLGKKIKHGEFGSIKLLRLAKKNAGRWKRAVHEFWKVKGKTFSLKSAIIHYSHEDIHSFVKDIDWYSTLHAQANYNEGKRSNIFLVILFPILKFFRNFFCKLGILDGEIGFFLSLMMSFHSFLAWSKLWLLQRRKTVL